MILFMDESKKSLQLIYNLCLFYLGNLLTSLFLRNIVGELVFIVGVVIVTVTLYRLSRIQGYGLKGGCLFDDCVCFEFIESTREYGFIFDGRTPCRRVYPWCF